MLKHKDLIDALSDEQKVRLLTDIGNLSSRKYSLSGIPTVRMERLDEYLENEIASSRVLERSWDTELVRTVATDRMQYMARMGIDLIELPSIKPSVAPYTTSMSEDPIFCTEMLRAYLDAADAVGVMPLVGGFDISDSDVKWIDRVPNHRTVFDILMKPYIDVLRSGRNIAFLVDSNRSKEYKAINSALMEMAGAERGNNVFVLMKNVPPQETVEKISKGIICVDASYDELWTALNRYKQLKQAISVGKATVSELEAEVANRTAISPESIDRAVNGLVEFAFLCSREKGSAIEYGGKELSYRAIRDSAVLLKNENSILPFKKEKKAKKLCVVGDVGDENGGVIDWHSLFKPIAKRNYEYTYTRGYDFSKDRDDLEPSATIDCVEKADRVVLLLGADRHRENVLLNGHHYTLPANQMALSHKLSAFGDKIIVVISSDCAVDMAFFDRFAAVLLLPLDSPIGIEAMLDILMGEADARGRLTSTMYSEIGEMIKKQLFYKSTLNMKVGPFVGYRRYDTEGQLSGYPFGHGLAYTGFAYSGLKIKKGEIEFTVKNIGKSVGSDVIQIYAGKDSSAVLRPKKELVAFEKLVLKPGEKKKVIKKFKPFEIYDPASKSYVTEGGDYTVYVGSSVSDIRLTGNIKVPGDSVETDYEKRSDYLQSESNVISDKYTLEADYKHMKRSSKNTLYGVLLLVIALALRLYCGIIGLDDIVIDIISVVIAVSAISLFIIEIYERKKTYAAEREEIDRANKAHFSDATQTPMLTAENMFINEFDVLNEERDSVELPASNSIGNEALRYIDKTLTLDLACREFMNFAEERGCRMNIDTVRNIFASLAASRLFVVRGMENGDLARLMNILCEYFGSAVYIDAVSGDISGENQLLYEKSGEGSYAKKNVLKAMEAARNEKSSIFFSVLTDVEAKNISSYFVPFARYIKNPLTSGSFTAFNEYGIKTAYSIPQNMWFVLNLKNGENIARLPEYVAEIATVNNIRFEKTAAKETVSVFHKFSYYQMDHLAEEAKKEFLLSEDDWKKIDRLAEYTNEYKSYSIGNKLWAALETYVSVFVVSGGEPQEALDHVLAVKLLPTVISAVKGQIPSDAPGLAETVNKIFGEVGSAMSNKIIAECAPEVK